jgi:hypothetical protein
MTRRGQIASQLHRCTFTCWKYSRYPGQRQCRFEGDKWDDPVHFHDDTIVHRDTDARNRVRIRVLPPRNNTHVNNTFVSPLVTAAMSQCNRDIKMVENEYGQVEYVCSYSGKAEAPDDNIFIRCLQKKFAKLEAIGQLNTQEQLKAVGNALLDAIAVQSVQVCTITSPDFPPAPPHICMQIYTHIYTTNGICTFKFEGHTQGNIPALSTQGTTMLMHTIIKMHAMTHHTIVH